MKNKITAYNVEVLNLLAKKYPERWDKIDFANKYKWLTKEDYPTYNQLVEVAKKFNIPFGYLFLDNLPEKKLPIPLYRTLYQGVMEMSDDLYDTIMLVKKQQEWAREILIEWGHQSLPFAGKFDLSTDKQIIIEEMRKILGLKQNWAEIKYSWKDALSFLVNKFEEAGIFVVINGVVGNNTHRKLDVNEFRGFVLYDDIAPFVFINNNDFVSAKIFTLIHEFVHILVGKSASFDLSYLQSADDKLEKFCDKCAAEFLVPTEEIMKVQDTDYETLARRFKVSQIVIARRLLDVGRITREEFFEFYRNYMTKERSKNASRGGDFFNTATLRYGRKFLHIVTSYLKSGNMLHREFYRLLSLKSSTAMKILNKSLA